MDIQAIERAASLFYIMCHMHPEICPHDYEWRWSQQIDTTGKKEHHYTCSLCGDEKTVIK